MSGRSDVTALLSGLVEKRLRSRRMFWAPEVSFDKGAQAERRIDYVGFKPFTPGYAVYPASVELGTFECYEVKSCMQDFTSGHGLTFYGDLNFLVTTREFAEELESRMLFPHEINGILIPNRPENALITFGYMEKGYRYGSQSYRKRVASEMLWQIMQARHHDDTHIVDMTLADQFARQEYPDKGSMPLDGIRPVSMEYQAFMAGVRWAVDGE